MKCIKPVIVLLSGVLLTTLLSGCQEQYSVVGEWKDTGGSYTVSFREDGTYVDSLTGLSLEYKEDSNELSYYAPSGDMCFVQPAWGFSGSLQLYIGGEYRKLTRADSEKSYVFPSDLSLRAGRNAEERYTLKSALPISSQVVLFEDNVFAYHLAGADVEQLDWRNEDYSGVRGLAYKTLDSRYIVMYYNQGESVKVLRLSPYGAYAADFPLSNDGELLVMKDFHNVSLGVESGYILDGTVYDTSNSTFYTFNSDSICVKSAQGGGDIRYNYYIDTEGLVSLSPVEGILSEDYLYYDSQENRIYRLVYQRDSWYDFITSTGVSSTQSSFDEEHVARVSSLNPLEHLALAYEGNTSDERSMLGDIDYSYTLEGIQTLLDLQLRLQQDEASRQEHEASRLSEQQKFLQRERERAREQARVKAEMDARVEAEIASGVQPTTSADDSSWLEDIIRQLEQSTGYDQDVSSTSPVVDIERPGQTSPSFSAPPETATPTEPVNSGIKETESPVSQFDSEFHIDFVCTCVNCYVSTLPVELDADNVLLVDASVIAPGTLVSVEGYGMVTARASGGTTSGQTAVCYSKSHNAVTRFSSGTYNVYQVVG